VALADGKLRHMALYYDNRYAHTLPLIFHLANTKLRHKVNEAVGAQVKSDNKSFAKFEALVNDASFLDVLERAAAGEAAARTVVVNEILPFIASSARKVPWGSQERAAEVTKLLALHRRHGPASTFLSLAPDDVHDLLSIRLAHAFRDHSAFPAAQGDAFQAAVLQSSSFESALEGDTSAFDMGEGALQQLAATNPVASAVAFQVMIDAVMRHLLCFDESGMTTKAVDERLKGIFGTALHATYVKVCGRCHRLCTRPAPHTRVGARSALPPHTCASHAGPYARACRSATSVARSTFTARSGAGCIRSCWRQLRTTRSC
jgi:hypothetical protein